MIKFNILDGKKGNVREILTINNNFDLVDISNLDWINPAGVLSELDFERFIFSNINFNISFNFSKFLDCTFSNIKVKQRFWGKSNYWKDCHFNNVSLKQVSCPLNKFDSCVFSNFKYLASNMYHTVFTDCIFTDFRLEGFAVPFNRTKVMPYSELNEFGVCVIFINCRFVKPIFSISKFAEVGFFNCQVQEPRIKNCDFKGAKGSPKWWLDEWQTDIFLVFLEEIIERITKKLGSQSSSVTIFNSYKNDYKSGLSKDKNFASRLYKSNLSKDELKIVETIIYRATNKFKNL